MQKTNCRQIGQDDDILDVGQIEASVSGKVYSPDAEEMGSKILSHMIKRPLVDIVFRNISYAVPVKKSWRGGQAIKTILKDLSGSFKAGHLTAILGPSGAGKTTLMNAMAGFKTKYMTGSVVVNGKERDLEEFRSMSSYIMQSDDTLLEQITVREALQVVSELKISKNKSVAAKKMIITDVLSTLGLNDCVDTMTASLSGGQRKRLMIAMELVNNPSVMFFDEPTSGLDSSSCLQVIRLLKCLSSEGRTIVCTIHQPSARIYEMLDDVLILSEGMSIYRGSAEHMVPYLSSMGLRCPSYHNPADFVIEVASGEHDPRAVSKLAAAQKEDFCKQEEGFHTTSRTPSGTCTPYNKDKIKQNHVKNPCLEKLRSTATSIFMPDSQQHYVATTWTQFKILLWRTFTCILRDDQLVTVRLFSYVSVGLLIGGLYWNRGNDASATFNNGAMIFFCCMFSMFAGMIPTLLEFPLEMKVFKREYLNHWYSVYSYYMAKTLADVPFQLLFPTIFCFLFYFFTDQPNAPFRFLMFLLTFLLSSLTSQSLGLLIGCAFDLKHAMFLGPLSVLPIYLLSGMYYVVLQLLSL